MATNADHHGGRRRWWRALWPGHRRARAAGATRHLGFRAPAHVVERLLRDYTIPSAVMLGFALLITAVTDMGNALRRAREVSDVALATVSQLAAEEAAFAAVRQDPCGAVATSWGYPVRVERVVAPVPSLELTVDTPRQRTTYCCDYLAGAAPACFGWPLTVGMGEWPEWIRGAGEAHVCEFPLLSLPPGPAAARLPELGRDHEVAFLHLPSGTDRADFTFVATARQVSVPGDLQVVEVDGNLWLTPSAEPLVLSLRAPLTLMVRGNVYLGRSLVVVGPHPCTIVAPCVAATFRDFDGNGMHSAGEPTLGDGPRATEGSGAIYLGLPSPSGALVVDAHLVAGGEVYLVRSAQLHGALVAGLGVTRCSGAGELELTGSRLIDVERERIPGFATSGSARPGRLHRVSR